MTAASTLLLRPNTATAGICWDHRLVPLRRYGALKERQHEGRMIRRGRSRAPVIGRRARQAKGDEIGWANGQGCKRIMKHGSPYHQRNIRQSESYACNSPTIGHNNSMNTEISAAKKKFAEACEKQAAGEMTWSAFRAAVESFNSCVIEATNHTDPNRVALRSWAEATRNKMGVSRYAEFA